MEPIVSFVTIYALLAKSQFLLAAAWVQSQALLAATSFAGATFGVQLAIALAPAALLAVILLSFYAYQLYKFCKKPIYDGEEESEISEPEEPEVPKPEEPELPEPKPQTIEEPDEFCCPIGNLELMTDPVIASDGQTYERADIEEYFQDGKNNLSPMTGVAFENHELIPNRKLKAEIDGYVALKNAKASVAEIKNYLNAPKPPAHFCCPISKEVMKHPVIADDGYSYQAENILVLFNKKNGKDPVSPVSGQPLKSNNLIPNEMLKADINGYLALKNQGAPAAQITAYLASLEKAPPLFASPPPPQGAAPTAGGFKIYDAADDSDIDEEEIKPSPPPVYESASEESEAEPANNDVPPPVFDDGDDLFADKSDDDLFALPPSFSSP